MEAIQPAERMKAREALAFITPILEKYHFRWAITGGFAAYAYGVPRELSDIDIDIEISKDDPKFKQFVEELAPYTTQSLEHFVDQNYDNYNFEITYGEQVIDICPMTEMKIFNKEIGGYERFYRDGYPATEQVDFEGIKLPLLAKELVIKNKEMLVWQRDTDRRDIEGLKAFL